MSKVAVNGGRWFQSSAVLTQKLTCRSLFSELEPANDERPLILQLLSSLVTQPASSPGKNACFTDFVKIIFK